MNKYSREAQAAKKQRRKEKMCLNKIYYQSIPPLKPNQKYYKCPYCDGYHITTKTPIKLINQIRSIKKVRCK